MVGETNARDEKLDVPFTTSRRRDIQKGLRLRAKFNDAVTIDPRHPDEYRVRSETGDGSYRVHRADDEWFCECKAFGKRKDCCKHIWAVRVPLERRSKLSTVAGGPLRTYGQDWPAYHAAQEAEHTMFDPLLWSLLDDIAEAPRPPGKRGRDAIPFRTQLMLGTKKVYLGESCERTKGLFEEIYGGGKGLPARVPSPAALWRVLNRPETRPTLLELIRRSAEPLREIEEGGTVAIDSSGFCTTCRGAYCTERYAPDRKHHWVKAHIMIGTRTHIILDVTITDERGADSPQFVPLLQSVWQRGFNPAFAVADKAYTSRDNYGAAAELGIQAYLPFKSNATGAMQKGHTKEGRLGTDVYRKMLLMFQLHRDEFDGRYHVRSNVEAEFSAVKRMLGEALRSKNPEARFNELLAKFLAYNITILVHEIHEHGVDPQTIGLPPGPKRPLPKRTETPLIPIGPPPGSELVPDKPLLPSEVSAYNSIPTDETEIGSGAAQPPN